MAMKWLIRFAQVSTLILLALFLPTQVQAAPPNGYFDWVDHRMVSGWTLDPDYSGSINIQVYFNDTFSGEFLANRLRTDVGGNFGFEIDHQILPPDFYMVHIYALGVDANGTKDGTRIELNLSPRNFIQPSYSSRQIKDVLIKYGTTSDDTYRPQDQKVNSFDTTYVATEVTLRPGLEIDLPTTRKVMVLEFNPIIESLGGQRLNVAKNWFSPSQLEDQYQAQIFKLTDGYLTYQIVSRQVIDDFPVKKDGYKYTDSTYLACASNSASCHSPDLVDYLKILSDYDVCAKRDRGEIDELWLWGAPWFGYYESTAVGQNAFYYNSVPQSGSTCRGLLPIMGFNYERALTEMTHDMGHRVEAVMTHFFNGWEHGYGSVYYPSQVNPSRQDTAWDDFTTRQAYTALVPNKPISCGNVHYAPNSPVYSSGWMGGEYDQMNTQSANSSCHEWLKYPNQTPATISENCTRWGCNDRFINYWLYHIPKYVGKTGLVWNNWWKYVLDYEQAAPSSTLVIFAEGTPSNNIYPNMRLLVNGTQMATWSNISTYNTYSYTHTGPLAVSDIKIEYTNDLDNVTKGQDRNLRIDKIVLDGNTYETEATTTLSTGTQAHPVNPQNCVPGFTLSEWLRCNGYFSFGQPYAYRSDFFNEEQPLPGYFNGPPELTRFDPVINFSWGTGNPDPGFAASNYFSARFSRTDMFQAATYRFTTTVDDGVIVYLDGVKIIDKFVPVSAPTTYSVDIPVSAGAHGIDIDYVEYSGNAQIAFDYQKI